MRIRHLSPLGREAISSIISNPHLSPVGGGGVEHYLDKCVT